MGYPPPLGPGLGYPPSQLDGVPPTWTLGWGTPPISWMGYPPPLGPGIGYPPVSWMGYPLPTWTWDGVPPPNRPDGVTPSPPPPPAVMKRATNVHAHSYVSLKLIHDYSKLTCYVTEHDDKQIRVIAKREI